MSTRVGSGQNPVAAAQRGGPRLRAVLYGALALLYLLHNDLWLWHDERLVLGLPAGLTYHLFYCLTTVVLMILLVRWAWPADLVTHDEAAAPEGERA